MHERPQGSHFHDPDLMNNPTKTAKGDEMTSQASSSSLPIVQPSIQLMPQLSKRFFVADKAERLFSFRLTCRRMDERVESLLQHQELTRPARRPAGESFSEG